MKFEEAIKIVGEEYVKKEIERMEEDEVTIKLPIRLKIRMWWMFKKEKIKSYFHKDLGSLQHVMILFLSRKIH